MNYVRPVKAVLLLTILSCSFDLRAETETMVVTTSREFTSTQDLPQNIAQISNADLAITEALHPYELAVRVPGAWISRGSGQEQLTAIRSPVLTGPGSCGAFLILEDGLPTRPTGFCNVNQLFEVPTELAESMEVIRGPSNAFYGSNGLHGTVNTLLPSPGSRGQTTATLEAGSNHHWRGRLLWDSGPADNAFSAGFVADSDGGYRDESGYDQAKGFLKSQHELDSGLLSVALSFSELDQETAGFITGFEAYKDPAVRFSNPFPEAYRRAGSRRFSVGWAPEPNGDWVTEWRFFLRDSNMNFLQHFLPGQPVEKNGQTSGGVFFLTRTEVGEGGELALGADTELAHGYLDQFQTGPTMGSAFLMETRPEGKHYDYEVDSYLAAIYANLRLPFADRWEFQAGIRAEYMHYDYNNKMLDGNTRDDGTPCGFGGCLYTRPADRDDDFKNLSPNLGLLFRISDYTATFINYTRGFRVPQATELYRLQSGQTTADIDSEELDSIELGIRHTTDQLNLEAVAFYMEKDNFIFRDAEGFNVSDGETSHRGVELNMLWRILEPLYFSFTGSYARQEYDFDRDAGRGEIIIDGNRIDTAPLKLASARLGYEIDQGRAELEWAYTDDYFLNAANTGTYEGHQLLNLRLVYDLTAQWAVGLRVNNLTDEVYADRADRFDLNGLNQFRYFTGHPREAFVSITWRTQ